MLRRHSVALPEDFLALPRASAHRLTPCPAPRRRPLSKLERQGYGLTKLASGLTPLGNVTVRFFRHAGQMNDVLA